MLDELASKTKHKDKEGDQWRKKNKTLNVVKRVQNTNKNPQSFLNVSPRQKEGSHKLQDHAYDSQNSLELKEDNPGHG